MSFLLFTWVSSFCKIRLSFSLAEWTDPKLLYNEIAEFEWQILVI